MVKRMKVFKEIMSYVLIIVLVLLFKKFVYSPIRVNGDSMNPTLKNGDIMIMNAIGYHINGLNRFDIVVVNSDERLIKRVIGLPGDYISYKDNILYVNGKEVEEDFDHDVTHNFEMSEITDKEVIPEGYYLVLGDNRGNSKDSRMIGLVSDSQIMGKVIKKVLFPFKRFGNVK